MKLIMVLVPSECLEGVQEVIERHEIHAYTEIPRVLGAGGSGRKLGTRAFPGTSSMFLVIVKAEEAHKVIDAVREYACESACSEGIRAFAVPAEMVI